MVMVPALGCGGDDEDAATTEAATTTSDDAGAGTGAAQAQLCPQLSGLEADLEDVSASGTEAGQDVLEGLGSFAAAFETAATTLTAAGATDAATAAEDLAANLESLSTSSGEDARALAGEAADGAQQLSDALQCP